MKIKNIFVLLLSILMFLYMQLPVVAAPNEDTNTEIIYFENGDYIEIKVETMLTRNTNTITGSKKATYKNSYGEAVYTRYTFGIDTGSKEEKISLTCNATGELS